MPALAAENQMLAAIAIPFAGALLIPLFHRQPNLREGVTLVASAALAVAAIVYNFAGPRALGVQFRLDLRERAEKLCTQQLVRAGADCLGGGVAVQLLHAAPPEQDCTVAVADRHRRAV